MALLFNCSTVQLLYWFTAVLVYCCIDLTAVQINCLSDPTIMSNQTITKQFLSFELHLDQTQSRRRGTSPPRFQMRRRILIISLSNNLLPHHKKIILLDIIRIDMRQIVGLLLVDLVPQLLHRPLQLHLLALVLQTHQVQPLLQLTQLLHRFVVDLLITLVLTQQPLVLIALLPLLLLLKSLGRLAIRLSTRHRRRRIDSPRFGRPLEIGRRALSHLLRGERRSLILGPLLSPALTLDEHRRFLATPLTNPIAIWMDRGMDLHIKVRFVLHGPPIHVFDPLVLLDLLLQLLDLFADVDGRFDRFASVEPCPIDLFQFVQHVYIMAASELQRCESSCRCDLLIQMISA